MNLTEKCPECGKLKPFFGIDISEGCACPPPMKLLEAYQLYPQKKEPCDPASGK